MIKLRTLTSVTLVGGTVQIPAGVVIGIENAIALHHLKTNAHVFQLADDAKKLLELLQATDKHPPQPYSHTGGFMGSLEKTRDD
jgi:hypothetical protein